jgi:hypothetical protein
MQKEWNAIILLLYFFSVAITSGTEGTIIEYYGADILFALPAAPAAYKKNLQVLLSIPQNKFVVLIVVIWLVYKVQVRSFAMISGDIIWTADRLIAFLVVVVSVCLGLCWAYPMKSRLGCGSQHDSTVATNG